MQTVNDKWYIIYRWVSLALGALLFVIAILNLALPKLLPFDELRNITLVTGALGAFHALFAATVYNRIARRSGHWAAMLLLSLFQATTAFSLLQTTGRMDSIFVIYLGAILFMSGVFGMYWVAGTSCVTVTYFILTTIESDGHSTYTQANFITLGALLLAALIGYLIWRNLYVDQDSVRVATLRGQLKTNQQQSEILVQSLTDGILLMSTDGVINLINPAAARMTGWSVEDATGTDYRSVVMLKNEDGSDLQTTENPITSIFETQVASTKILQLINRDGKMIVVSLVTSPVLDPKTQELTGAVAVIRDISVTHQSEKQRAEFVSTASHEMRTPVAAIEGYLQLALNEKVAKVDPKARDFLVKALDSTHHLGQLFQDLLTSAKAEDGRLVSHPSVVEMGEYLETLSETFRFSADKKGLLTNFVFGASTDSGVGSQAGEHVVRPLYYVHVDPDRLREVITNLFDNAVKYTPSGKISVGLTGNQDVVQLFVRDTGPGIGPEDLPHLFQKFYRVDNSATRTIGGTGLGLFICRKIIELYRGRIWAESTVGQGSTFYINLPRLSTQRASELKIAEAQSGASTPISSLTTPV